MKKRGKVIQDFGGDGEVIILLHGFLASSKYWWRLQPHLSKAGYRVITMDLFGFGNAPKPRNANYTYDEYIRYINDNIKTLRLKRPFILVGHSMGAMLAARYSLYYSYKVKSLVLLHPPIYRSLEEAERVLRSTGRVYRFLLDFRFRSIGWFLVRVFSFHNISKHNKDSRENSFKNVIGASEILDDLKRVKTRTLLLVGLLDRHEYRNNLKNTSLSPMIKVVYERISHHSPVLRSKLVSKIITDFIK